MNIGMIGLGRMGENMARRLLAAGHQVVAYNRTPSKVQDLVSAGARGAATLDELVRMLPAPRIVWLMLPAGEVLETHIAALAEQLSLGDMIVDGGNSFFKDDITRHAALSKKGIRYVDAGVSGGIWGLKNGYCAMVGGDKVDFDTLEPVLKALAPADGTLYCGGPGAGHFVKMVHNGIEYGMMQAYAEGFELLAASPYGFDLGKVAHLWNQGSVVRSWLLELAAEGFQESPDLGGIAGYVEDSGEGRWTVQQAVELGVSLPAISIALYQRFLSRQKDAFSNKVLAALRNKFGGHALVKEASERNAGAGAGGVSAARGETGVKPAGMGA